MAASSASSGVWALSLSTCGDLLAAVSSDGRLEVRSQKGKPASKSALASFRLVSRGLLQLQDAHAAVAAAEGSERAICVLLGEAADAPPPLAPDGQAPTPPHLALRVVAVNPNPAHRQWVVTAGPSGLLACVRMPAPEELDPRARAPASSGKPKGRPPSGKPKGRPPLPKGGAPAPDPD